MNTRAEEWSEPFGVPPPRDSFADALVEASEVEDATFEERYRLLEAACAFVFEVIARHPEREEILAYRAPLPPDAAERFERARRMRPPG